MYDHLYAIHLFKRQINKQNSILYKFLYLPVPTKLKMLQGVTLAAIFACVVAQATGINYYYCKPRGCDVRAHTESGWACGRLRDAEDGARYASFRGVPYAKPPIGHRRFQELEPMEPWGDNVMLDATEDAPACPQTDLIYGRIPLYTKGMSEDCMHLNIHVPYRSLPRFPWTVKEHGLPILVFVHGGAYQSGAGLTDALGPEYLMMKNIIVITFNYRIGALGFLYLNTKEAPGNQGLRDVLTLLRWVQRNARSFGGDPNNVTLMGQSAGATTAHILSLTKAAEGLFKRVILMSSTAIPSYFTTSTKHATVSAEKFLTVLGINQTDPVLIHEELTKLPLLKIMHANSAVQFDKMASIVPFNPVVETNEFPGVSTILDQEPISLMAQGRGREFPMLISYTDNEMAFAKWLIYMKNTVAILNENPKSIVSPRLTNTLPESEVMEIALKIRQRYFNETITADGVLQYFTDMFVKHPTLKVAEWRAASGGAPTYMYQFAYDFEFSAIKAAHWVDYQGSAHMDDLSCIFRVNSILRDYISYPPKNTDDAMKYWMVYLIKNFMICSNPTCNNKAIWPSLSKDIFKYNLIKRPMTMQMMDPTSEENDMVEFFDSFDPESRYCTTQLQGE